MSAVDINGWADNKHLFNLVLRSLLNGDSFPKVHA